MAFYWKELLKEQLPVFVEIQLWAWLRNSLPACVFIYETLGSSPSQIRHKHLHTPTCSSPPCPSNVRTAQNHPMASRCMMILLIMMSTLLPMACQSKPLTNSPYDELLSLPIADDLHVDPESIGEASVDYGLIVREIPLAVLRPSYPEDIATLVAFVYNEYSVPLTISARGCGHSVHGQAMARDGVVVDMTSLGDKRRGTTVSWSWSLGHYADVSGQQLWIDVLEETLKHGVAPVSWTDYLYLTLGGTLSNAGISGETFRYGPQISNVYEMDVITGTGHFLTCSPHKNPQLFYSVLGGLGQFGIITRARIALGQAPKRAKWVRMLYSDFSAFTMDHERLISRNGRDQVEALDYVEGMLVMRRNSDSWISFFSPSDHQRLMSLVTEHELLYCIEVAKFNDGSTQSTVDKDLEMILKDLRHVPEFLFQKDVAYVDFLSRAGVEQGPQNKTHPWLNLFVPKSRIADFNTGVFKNIVLKKNITTGLVLIYPMNHDKWDDRMSAAIPDEDVFYTVGFLHSSGLGDWQEFDLQNKEVLLFCEDNGIKVKQYLPNYSTEREWMEHFGPKWRTFQESKAQFDPKMLLSPGQRIFNHN
ncbi:cytokinin dehydrogenase 3-like [Syzygium oleosum]|uniref:cytokinin dehydrogenase 3-like n=1 Tax=Syzygium oleosum TaxID=219896 RepID=UPI0011D1CA8C|nr:cytokinin dehydrogenase 3-like [Syzygium oleosum]